MKLVHMVMIALFTLFTASLAVADTSDWIYYSGGYGKSVHYRWRGALTASYDTNIANAAARWNQTDTPVYAYYSSTSSNTYQVGMGEFANYTWYGLYTSYADTSGAVTRFDIAVNHYRITVDGYDTVGLESTLAHEIGHGFGLGDLSYGDQLMSLGRERERIYTPQSGDIHGLNVIWR